MAIDAGVSPLHTLGEWLERAESAGHSEPGAMVLATADADGMPNARYVLLRGIDDRGICFYSNYESAKARELEANPRAAAVVGWPALQRQVRVRGPVEKLTPGESDAYWRGRPRGSQLGAWASPQSRPIPDRAVLEAALGELEAQYADAPTVPRPPHWGGYRIVALEVELWLGQRDRLHDRFLHRREAPGKPWTQERLGP